MPIITGRTCPVCHGEFDEFGRRIPCDHCNSTGGIYDQPLPQNEPHDGTDTPEPQKQSA